MPKTFPELVREMRTHERGSAEEAFYSKEDWSELCKQLDSYATRYVIMETMLESISREVANTLRMTRQAKEPTTIQEAVLCR